MDSSFFFSDEVASETEGRFWLIPGGDSWLEPVGNRELEIVEVADASEREDKGTEEMSENVRSSGFFNL